MEYEDFNLISSTLEKELYDRFLYELLGQQENKFFGSSFYVSYSSGIQVAIAAGLGIQTGSADDSKPVKTPIYKAASTNHAVTAAHATLGRKDIVCIKSARATALTESRDFKDASDDSVSSQSMVVQTDWSYDISIVAGTPDASPVAPSTPSGYIRIALIDVPAVTGPTSQSSITDERDLFSTFPTQKTFNMTNNQSSAANVTGLLFDPNILQSVIINYDIYRQSATALTECREVGRLILVYSRSESTWTIDRIADATRLNDTGVEFSMSGNQLQYTTTNISGGSNSDVLNYKVEYNFL